VPLDTRSAPPGVKSQVIGVPSHEILATFDYY
jgi:hypothetical protein